MPAWTVAAAALAAGWWAVQAEAAPPPPAWLRALPLVLALGPCWRLVHDRCRPRALIGVLTFTLAMAAIGLAVAPSWTPAAGRFWLIVGGCVLAAAIAGLRTSAELRSTLVLIAIGAAGLAILFIATNDWDTRPVKFAWLALAGRQAAGLLPSVPVFPRMHPNVVAGILTTLWPFAAAMALSDPSAWMRRGAALLTLIAAGGIVLSGSRGAWVANALVVTGWIVVRARRHRGLTAGIACGALLAIGAAFVLPAVREATTQSGRVSVQRQAWALVQDYGLIGAGLGSFPRQFATYAQVAAVDSSVHAHHLLLDVVIEQGVGGLAALIAVVALTFTASTRTRHFTTNPFVGWAADAALASQSALLLHGLVDDTLSASRGLPALFLPVGVSVAAARLSGSPLTVGHRRWIGSAGLGIIALLALAATADGWSARWHATLGAIAQAKAELTVYDQRSFDAPTLDEVRRRVDLSAAERHFKLALAADPAQVTAARRLTLIALARRQYEDAFATILPAWSSGHHDRTTRLVLGDAMVATGRREDAVGLLRGDDAAAARLKSEGWYRYWRDGDYARAADAWTTAAALNPGDLEAVTRAAEARARLAATAP